MAEKPAKNHPPAGHAYAEPVAPPKNGGYPRLRAATTEDLDAINRVIESAIATWNLPQRVKRISLPLYRYQRQDLEFLHMAVFEPANNEVAAVASWDKQCDDALPTGQPALLLHGIYVSADRQRQGIGSRLLQAAEQAVERCGCAVLVKAQADAEPFFLRHGYRKLAVADPQRDYPHRYCKPPAAA